MHVLLDGRFAGRLPELRTRMSENMDCDCLCYERVSATAVRLINHGWFRVGNERYAKTSRTFGITTLRKGHVTIRGSRITFPSGNQAAANSVILRPSAPSRSRS